MTDVSFVSKAIIYLTADLCVWRHSYWNMENIEERFWYRETCVRSCPVGFKAFHLCGPVEKS